MQKILTLRTLQTATAVLLTIAITASVNIIAQISTLQQSNNSLSQAEVNKPTDLPGSSSMFSLIGSVFSPHAANAQSENVGSSFYRRSSGDALNWRNGAAYTIEEKQLTSPEIYQRYLDNISGKFDGQQDSENSNSYESKWPEPTTEEPTSAPVVNNDTESNDGDQNTEDLVDINEPEVTPEISTPEAEQEVPSENPQPVFEASGSGNLFSDTFSKNGSLIQASQIQGTDHPDWWLSSGGILTFSGGIALSLQGDQSPDSDVYQRYAKYNPAGSDGGLHPQNIFRLVTLSNNWGELTQQVQFKINKLHLSDSSARNASNGVLLFNRYQDQYTLYYTGVRVDGSVVIKKKYEGKYTTLDINPFFDTNGKKYNRDSNPNFLPLSKWMGIKSTLEDLSNGDVRIRLYVDRNNSGNWELAAEATDNGSDGNPPIRNAGHGGVRTDFMDMALDNFRIGDL